MANHRYGLIMAGGRGTRFWPRSRKRNSKQVLRFFGDRTLIQQTGDRLSPEIPKEQVIAEPAQRNTAPCIALAAQVFYGLDPEAVMGVFPADHLILKEARFRTFVKAAFRA